MNVTVVPLSVDVGGGVSIIPIVAERELTAVGTARRVVAHAAANVPHEGLSGAADGIISRAADVRGV